MPCFLPPECARDVVAIVIEHHRLESPECIFRAGAADDAMTRTELVGEPMTHDEAMDRLEAYIDECEIFCPRRGKF